MSFFSERGHFFFRVFKEFRSKTMQKFVTDNRTKKLNLEFLLLLNQTKRI